MLRISIAQRFLPYFHTVVSHCFIIHFSYSHLFFLINPINRSCFLLSFLRLNCICLLLVVVVFCITSTRIICVFSSVARKLQFSSIWRCTSKMARISNEQWKNQNEKNIFFFGSAWHCWHDTSKWDMHLKYHYFLYLFNKVE